MRSSLKIYQHLSSTIPNFKVKEWQHHCWCLDDWRKKLKVARSRVSFRSWPTVVTLLLLRLGSGHLSVVSWSSHSEHVITQTQESSYYRSTFKNVFYLDVDLNSLRRLDYAIKCGWCERWWMYNCWSRKNISPPPRHWRIVLELCGGTTIHYYVQQPLLNLWWVILQTVNFLLCTVSWLAIHHFSLISW